MEPLAVGEDVHAQHGAVVGDAAADWQPAFLRLAEVDRTHQWRCFAGLAGLAKRLLESLLAIVAVCFKTLLQSRNQRGVARVFEADDVGQILELEIRQRRLDRTLAFRKQLGGADGP